MNYTKKDIASTIILYNPTDDIFQNIDSFIQNVDILIVVDNSETLNTTIKEKLLKHYKNLEYIYNGQNLGIATALNIACDKAIELKYSWILTMDQDSCFINFKDYITCLNKINNPNNTALLAGNTMWHAKDNIPSNPSYSPEEKFLVITSGNLLNLNLFNKIGRFEDKLFIDMVDHDYCMKANRLEYKILYFKDILIEHSLGTLFKRKNLFTGKIRNKIEHSPQRAYYITRNYFYTWKIYHKQFPKEFNLLKTINIMFIHEVTKILIYEDQKVKKLYAKIVGLVHFLRGKYGKYLL